MRTVKTHATECINFTDHARILCQILNEHKRQYPTTTFKELAELCQMSETNVRRYYYGIHHKNFGFRGNGYSQVRQGACVAI